MKAYERLTNTSNSVVSGSLPLRGSGKAQNQGSEHPAGGLAAEPGVLEGSLGQGEEETARKFAAMLLQC